MGGIAIAVATVIGFSVGFAGPVLESDIVEWSAVLIAALAMFVVGLFDDRLQAPWSRSWWPRSPLARSSCLRLRVSSPMAPFHQLHADRHHLVCRTVPLLQSSRQHGRLAAGVALIATAFMAALIGPSLGVGLFILLIALVGALAGFLYWNRPRARLFMGDCSLFIGAILGGVARPVFHARIAFVSPTVLAVLILVVPLFDTAFVLVLRRLAGRSATRGGTDHVSHRLVSLGFSERSAVRILYALGLIGD